MRKGTASVSIRIEGDVDIADLDNYDMKDLLHEALKAYNVEWWAAQIADETGSIIAVERQ